MPDTELWMLIGRRLCARLIPRAPCSGVWAGRGKSGSCGLCGFPIAEQDVYCEVELPPADGHTDHTLFAHIDCHQVWTELSQIAAYGPTRKHSRPPDLCVRR